MISFSEVVDIYLGCGSKYLIDNDVGLNSRNFNDFGSTICCERVVIRIKQEFDMMHQLTEMNSNSRLGGSVQCLVDFVFDVGVVVSDTGKVLL